MLSRFLKSGDIGRRASRSIVWRAFAEAKLKTGETSTAEAEEGQTKQKVRRNVEKLGIVDSHVPSLRENPNTDWIRKLDFDSKIKPVLNKYKELGLAQEDLNILANSWPEGFVLNNNAEKKMDVFELSSHLASKYGVTDPKLIRGIITTAPRYLMISRSELDERVDRLKKYLNLDDVIF
jgi:hypothetical protein